MIFYESLRTYKMIILRPDLKGNIFAGIQTMVLFSGWMKYFCQFIQFRFLPQLQFCQVLSFPSFVTPFLLVNQVEYKLNLQNYFTVDTPLKGITTILLLDQ